MTQLQKRKNIRKQKIIVVTGLIIILLIILAILAAIVLHFQSKNTQLAQKQEDVLYYSEETREEKSEENNVLVVGIDEKNNVNKDIETDKPQENNQTPTKEQPKKAVDIPYYIKINNQANVVTIYKKDSDGKYTKPVKAMVCSIGDATPSSGVYTISDKYVWRLLQGNVYGQYACRITGHILFHSVPYEKQDKSTLEWWEYDKLGTKASLGCIRLSVQDVKWIYDNCVAGTKVEFYSSSNPGPLGKPTAQKISNDESVRNWDPTDPDKNNPWRTYAKNVEDKNTTKETTTKPVENDVAANTNTTNNNTTQNKVSNSKTENKVETNPVINSTLAETKNEI